MTRLRIGIDGFNLAMPNGTGVATYGYALTETLRSMDIAVEGVFGIPVGERPALREILFYEALARGVPPRKGHPAVRAVLDWIGSYRGVRAFDVPETGFVERRYLERRIPRFDRVVSAARLFDKAERYFLRTKRFYPLTMPDPPAIMHWTYPVPLTLKGARNVYTLHDLVPLKLPYATLDRKRVYYRMIERCVADADHICTVSESSRRDLIEGFGIAPERVTNTFQIAPMPADLVGEEAAGADAAGIFGLQAGGYFLYFGAIEPKKNVARLIEAYLSTRLDTPLVIVGARAWQSEQDLQLVSSGLAAAGGAFGKSIAQRVVRLDYLPRALLLRLVASARAVVFPSLYEGFGLPVLEAMQLGTPVITSNTSSLPEVAGDAALMVNPYDTAAIAGALIAMDRDPELRARLAGRGRERAALFSADAYRDRLSAMYNGIMQGVSS